MDCNGCEFREDVWLTGYSGIGLFKASICGEKMQLVEPGIDRECAKWKGKVIAVTPA